MHSTAAYVLRASLSVENLNMSIYKYMPLKGIKLISDNKTPFE